ncbi:gluconate operon transcriptional repressor GntR [Budviciaceae bacterium CWB-B4]|uniref:Gluconate operon transcriptional repressor GntR n=1 Tax=Limnobaculum xujianqingii TaxID=2738837 RepID=A0A9D7ALA2_9GAMM|nr:gluconate operon transcriptional repressor GntR [Limnobaculum xujianqingii]MBK5074929.1 gluconate operon transcriptional repressor GntR [Limnobaculum xujianqingii]MBK5178195.1 gluconate operon transcriptional repressor GntR [Limnobaculum xujianqingii]
MKKKRPGLQDVANQVGVTKMTISRYLRDPSQVSATLRGKIAVALDELGYIPNRAPEILSNATSRAIGVLLPSLTNQVFAEVLRGIESVTDSHGYQTMLAHYGYRPEREEMRLTSLLSYNIDGLILSERTHTERTRKMIEVAGIPVIEIMDSASPCIDLAVGFNNHDAAYQMTKEILQNGHLHTVYLGARQDERTVIKMQGYEQAMREFGLEPRSVCTDRSSSYSLGCELLKEAFRRYPETDSIFCTNDDIAIGAAFECQRLGLRIPDDMAIAGFHGHDIGQSMEPKLTSVLTPREQMGQVAAERLLARLRGETVTPKMLDLGFKILHGGSI